jgi:hypothetical protein
MPSDNSSPLIYHYQIATVFAHRYGEKFKSGMFGSEDIISLIEVRKGSVLIFSYISIPQKYCFLLCQVCAMTRPSGEGVGGEGVNKGRKHL